jgi:ADP-ribose pyrophosphatase YjhB (NUDIX family)
MDLSLFACNISNSLCFKDETEIFSSLKLVETAYWNYIDNYNKDNPMLYPYYKFVNFLQEILLKHHSDVKHLAYFYVKIYNKYKKSIATDGVIMYALSSLNLPLSLNIVVVKISGSKLWSMPKGKRESNETSLQCAVREFAEETGIDLSETLSNDTEIVTILKTVFFIQEADCLVDLNDYKTNEIECVKWVSINEIQCNKDLYSKQTYAVADFMVSYLKI